MLQNGIVWIAYWKWDDPEAGCHIDTCFGTHYSVIPLRPLAGSSLHRFRQSLSTAHQPTSHCRITGSAQHQPSWNSITTWPARVGPLRKTTSSVTPSSVLASVDFLEFLYGLWILPTSAILHIQVVQSQFHPRRRKHPGTPKSAWWYCWSLKSGKTLVELGVFDHESHLFTGWCTSQVVQEFKKPSTVLTFQ